MQAQQEEDEQVAQDSQDYGEDEEMLGDDHEYDIEDDGQFYDPENDAMSDIEPKQQHQHSNGGQSTQYTNMRYNNFF